MLSVMKKSVLLVGAFLVLGGGMAFAAVSNMVEVKVPFPFVVHGKAFPAGQYTVQREDAVPSVWLMRGEGKNHAASFMLTMPAAGHDPAGETPALTFRRYENQYHLTGIWESENEGQTVMGR